MPTAETAGAVSKDPTLEVERACFASGALLVIGVDEVGRGAIAGPVAVGVHAIAADVGEFPAGLRDSKLLSERRRGAPGREGPLGGAGPGGPRPPAEIDERGISWALGEAGRRAVQRLAEAGLPIEAATVLLDGRHDWLSPALERPDPIRPYEVRAMVGADRSCASVAAASVSAKVERDALMRAADQDHPGYAWASNKGYGARAHYDGLSTLGLTPLHRRSFIH